ncbi:MAG: GNAT family N-acetyltransferase [Candidatus Pacearchaeota archaeon]
MKIRKATKKDLKDFICLRKEWDKEYSKMMNRKFLLKEVQIKKEFNEILENNKKRILLFLEDDGEKIGFLIATLIKNIYSRNNCYLDDIFILKNCRRRGLAAKFMNEFNKLLKKKKIGSLLLGVNLKNKVAQKLYEKLGFKVTHYEMEKKVK